MKNKMMGIVVIALVSIVLTSCNANKNNENITPTPMTTEIPDSINEPTPTTTLEKNETIVDNYNKWEKEYRDFLFSYTFEEYDFRIIPQIWLIDLNTDNQPELVVLHHSGGSMGGYFKFYYYDGSEVKKIMNNEGEPFRCTLNAKIYQDHQTNDLLMYKEMTGFLGNYEMCYGYLRKIIDRNGQPFVNNLIQVAQVDDISYEKAMNANTENEDAVISNEDLVLAEEYTDGTWRKISGKEYIQKKHQIIKLDKQYVDYWEKGCHIILDSYSDYNYESDKLILAEDEIKTLFLLWRNNNKQ